MVLIEALGIEQFQERVQIYGTDVDPDAIQQAYQGHYPSYAVELFSPELQEQYFERREDFYCWRQNCYSIHFQVHNLIKDPPLSHIDLLVCRNLLMYLTTETQLQVLTRFHSSLKQDGFLILGKVENLVGPLERSLFTPIHRQARVFKKVLDVLY